MCCTSIDRPRMQWASSSNTRAPTASTAPPGRATRSDWPRRRCCRPRRSPACRRSSIASVPRRRKAAMAHSKEKQIVRLEAQRVHVGKGDRTLRVKFPDPPDQWRHRHHGARTVEGVRRTTGVRRRVVRCRSWRSAAGARPQRRRQDQPVAHPRRRDHRQRRRVQRSATTSTSATTRRSTTTCRVTRRCSTTSALRYPTMSCSPRRSCAACWA